jgi:undecaprenyl-diphosphatase
MEASMSEWLVQIDFFDRRLLSAVARGRRSFLTPFMRAVSRLVDPVPAVLIALFLLSGPVPALQAAGRDAAMALLLSHCIAQGMKRAICRSRPHLAGEGCLVEMPDPFSVPSGHAAAALSIALPVFLALPLVLGAPVLGLAFLIGASRCYLGVHYPADVLMGWGLAVGSVALVG